MKNMKKILAVTAFVTAFGFVNGASAGGYQATGDDGITASPKARQLLNEQNAKTAAASSMQAATIRTVGYQGIGDDGITASPRYRQMLTEQYAQVAVQLNAPQVASTKAAGYQATGDDGITASPKARQFLNEHSVQVQVAPVK